MQWYPWLNSLYRKIIISHQKSRGHHALLIRSNPGMGSEELIYAVSRWIMCRNPFDIKSCGSCYSCHLMLAKTHPDWHTINVEKGKNIIGIEKIKHLLESLFTYAQQGGARVIWFPRSETLSEEASNALLKILEEPPIRTYFLLECNDVLALLPTLRSRCCCYYLFSPEYKKVIFWLQKKLPSSLRDIETAVKVNSGSPLSALSLLQPENWVKRKRFFQSLLENLEDKTLFNWLSELDQPDVAERISWLMTLLIDAVKYQKNASNYCVNQDQWSLIIKLSSINSANILLKSAIEWQNCRYQLISVMGLNQELRLAAQLINWQSILYNHN